MLEGIKVVESSFVWFHRLIDALIPVSILYFLALSYSLEWTDRYLVMGIVGGLFFILFSQATGTYSNWRGRPSLGTLKMIFHAWCFTWMSLIVIAFLIKDSNNFSRLVITSWALLTPLVLIIYRLLLKAIISATRDDKNTRNIAIAGAGKIGQYIGSIINKNKWLGYKLVAYYDDDISLHHTNIKGVPVLGSIDTISIEANNKLFDEIYICLPLRAEFRIKQLLNLLTDTTAIVKFVPDLFSFDLMHARWTELNGIPVISVYDTPLDRKTTQLIKRTEDLILSIIILLLICPVMIILCIGVKLSSRGPIFYKQSRVGWNGISFNILKFRSMPIDIENNSVEWGNASAKINTKFGQFIRKYNLDELPQFINVLKGDMSIVGPRPERDIFVEKFRKKIPRYMQKHMVKAGITGWAQINGWRGDTSIEKRVEYDLDYIKRWSVWLDIKIILLTIFKAFKTGT